MPNIELAAMIFFFSNRRRHTRWPRDWSSDVCSSDLVGGCPRIRPPRKRRMIGHQNRRNHGVVDVAKRADNGVPGVLFVILRDFGVFQFYRDGNRSMEGIRVGGAKARNRSARLCPGGRVFRMGMAHAAYAGEG